MLKYLEIGNSKIPMFTLMICIGFLLAILIFFKTCKKRKIEKEYFDKLCLVLPFIIVGGIFGAMIFDKIAHWGEKPWYIPAGISFAGGLIMGVILFFISHLLIMKKGLKSALKDAEIFICPLLIAHSFGRIGCFFGGCCYGKPSDSIFAVTFPEGSLQHLQYGYITPVLPTQLFEATFLLILFTIMILFIKKYRLVIYLFAYGIFRFFLEFLRGDNRGNISNIFSPSQITSIIFIICGIILLVYILKVKPYSNNEQTQINNNEQMPSSV